jgi:hypothetical protein
VAISLVQTVGSNNSKAAATSLSVQLVGGTKPQAGDMVVVFCARDNVAADPLTGDSISADPAGNTYTRHVVGSNLATAAAGIVGVMFWSVLTASWPAGTNTITWGHPSITSRAMQVAHFVGVLGARAGNPFTGTVVAGTALAATATNPVLGDAVIGLGVWENSSAITGDSDTSNGSWSAINNTNGYGTSGGTAATNVRLGWQWKAVTATGSQTYNQTNTSNDGAAVVASFTPKPVAFPYLPAPRRGSFKALLTR